MAQVRVLKAFGAMGFHKHRVTSSSVRHIQVKAAGGTPRRMDGSIHFITNCQGGDCWGGNTLGGGREPPLERLI